MENKGGDQALPAAEAPAVATANTVTMREAVAAMEQLGPVQGSSMSAWAQWATIKSKVRAAGEHAVLRTRQGISMFGEPKLGYLIEAGAAKDDLSQQ